MKIFKNIIIAIVVLVIIVLIIGFFSPRKVTFERSIIINASSSSIFEEINSVKAMQAWMSWAKIDPEGTQYTYEGPESGVGSKVSWKSEHPDVGAGVQSIVESVKNEKTRTELYFEGYDNPNYADIIILKDNGANKVTWTFEGDMGSNPIYKLMGLFMENMLGPSYEKGLKNLKELVESKPIFSIQIGIEEVNAISYLAINHVFDLTKPETIGPKFGEIYGKIMGYMTTNNLQPAGMPMSVTLGISDTEWNNNVAIPWGEESAIPSGDIIVSTTMGGKVIKGIHLGSYDKLNESYAQMVQYMKYKKLESSGDVYEVYQTDPMNEPDTAKWQTHLFYPVK